MKLYLLSCCMALAILAGDKSQIIPVDLDEQTTPQTSSPVTLSPTGVAAEKIKTSLTANQYFLQKMWGKTPWPELKKNNPDHGGSSYV